jgi:hypothetical protein
MKIQEIDSNFEQHILMGMIVDKIVLGRISSKWQSGMFRTNYANLIANWCVDYFNKYEKAPMKNIESLFQTWADTSRDKNTITLIEKFLFQLSNKYKKLKRDSNSEYVIDISGKYFNQVKLEKLKETIEDDIDSGKINKAIGRVNNFSQIELGGGEGVNVLQDEEAIKLAFEDKVESLVTYPGALGKFFGNSLCRDGFIDFLAPEKRGKSTMLLDVAFRAMSQRRKVAFFEAGDMSRNQVVRRIMTRVAKRPLYFKEVNYPVSIVKYKTEDYATVIHKTKKYSEQLDWREALKQCKFLMKDVIKSKKPYWKLSCHTNSTLKVKDIQNILKGWERDGWVPDVIIIDYADILNMDYPHLEGRDRINETWKQMRAMSQIYHCLVVTATQANARSFEKNTIGRNNYSDDKRKVAHVTGEIGISQETEEKVHGIIRLNWTARREDEFFEDKCVYVAGCLRLCNPTIKSCFEENI